MRKPLLIIATAVLSLTGIVAWFIYGPEYGGHEAPFARSGLLVAFSLLMIPYFALGFDLVVASLRDMAASNRSRFIIMGLWLIVPGMIVLISAGARMSPQNLAVLVAYVSVPIVLLSGWGQSGPRPSTVDVVALLLLWLPVEMQLFESLWNVPAANPSYVLAKTLGMELALFCFVVVRRLDGVGYRFRLAAEDVTVGAIALGAFLILAIPTALGTGFVEFEVRWQGFGHWILTGLGIFFFIAIPEEVLFRGLIFNMLQRMMRARGPWPALIVSSVIFGLAHLNNPPGDWRYVLLASMAGVAYGWAYLRTGSLLAPSYAHALVDLIGRTFFPHDSG